MSTRYVWGKYSVEKNAILQRGGYNGTEVDLATHVNVPFTIYSAKEITLNNNGTVTFKNPVQHSVSIENQYRINADEFVAYSTYSYLNLSNVFWGSPDGSSYVSPGWVQSPTVYAFAGIYGGVYSSTIGYEDIKGSLTGYASSATDGQYPSDGVSGNLSLFAHTNRKTIALQGVA